MSGAKYPGIPMNPLPEIQDPKTDYFSRNIYDDDVALVIDESSPDKTAVVVPAAQKMSPKFSWKLLCGTIVAVLLGAAIGWGIAYSLEKYAGIRITRVKYYRL